MLADVAPEDVGREENDLGERIDRLHETIKKSLARTARFIIGLDTQTHVRMVVDRFVFSVTAAGTLTLNVGNQSYLYNIGANGPFTVDVPAPVTIVDRGVRITAIAAGGAALSLAYLTYKAE